MTSNTDIRYLKGVGEKRAEFFKKLGIETVDALLTFYPRTYEDWSKYVPISSAANEDKCCVRAIIVSDINCREIRKNMTVYRFTVKDISGKAYVTLFNNKYLAEKLHVGSEYLFYGKFENNSGFTEISSPEIREVGYNYIRPIYPATAKLSSNIIEKTVKTALSAFSPKDILPIEIREKYALCELSYALRNIHFPASYEAYASAKKRLIFEELFVLQCGLTLLKFKKTKSAGISVTENHKPEFLKLLPYEFTNAQSRVTDECINDMLSGKLMSRLIQGDVGSGKTAVAAAVCHTVVKNGYQAAIMVPTEILANQHFATFTKLFDGTGITCDLLTGSLTKKKKELVKARLSYGGTDIIIGTHALLTDDVTFKSLGLIVTDEQHRFGVEQRAVLGTKGNSPHTLVMSATPIPRTLGLIIYGELDISIIDEYPQNRQTIESYCVDESYRNRIYNFIKKHIDQGRQAYIVCPLVENSENSENLISAEDYCEKISQNEFSNYRTGLLHGKMTPKEKDAVMTSFKNGEIDLLISTTVIEVGIDVPNANIMVVENAEHFGLSQLHQLRGRIGRGQYKSYCVFVSGKPGQPHPKRLNILCSTADGFKIADEDLKLRGPGDFLGKRQHGLPEFKIADMLENIEELRTAGKAAAELIKSDPELTSPEHKPLKERIDTMLKYSAN